MSVDLQLSSFRGDIMETKRNCNIDVKKTVKNSVCGNEEFHFFVDELASNDCMPTYAGKADEKYEFEDMDDEFFEFLNAKSEKMEFTFVLYMQQPVKIMVKLYLNWNMVMPKRNLEQWTLTVYWYLNLLTLE